MVLFFMGYSETELSAISQELKAILKAGTEAAKAMYHGTPSAEKPDDAADKRTVKKTGNRKPAVNRKLSKKDHKVISPKDQISRKDAKKFLYSTGLYVHYAQMSRDQVLAFLKRDHLLFSPASEEKSRENIQHLIEYTDKHARNYRKKGARTGKTYMNVYAHCLTFLLPKDIPFTDDAIKLRDLFFKYFDARLAKLVTVTKVYRLGRCRYMDVMIFTRPVLAEPLNLRAVYDSDYYWDTEKLRRASAKDHKKHPEKVILRHHKGEQKKDADGKPAVSEEYCASRDLHIFTFLRRCENMRITGFEVMMETIKNAYAKATDDFRGTEDETGGVRHMISYEKHKKGKYRSSTLIKVKRKNALIRQSNARLTKTLKALKLSGIFDDDEEVRQKWGSLIHTINETCHSDHFRYMGVHVRMDYRGTLEQYSERLLMLKSRIGEIFSKFQSWMDQYLYKAGIGPEPAHA